MSFRYNPFQPNSPVSPGMFVGRWNEVLALEKALAQTRSGQPKHFMLTGERGIGKTSLLDYLRWLAKGEFELEGTRFNFLVLDVDIEKATTPASLARKIQRAVEHELGQTEKARSFLKKTWSFLSRVEAFGVGIDQKGEASSDEDLLDELAYSLAETATRLCAERVGDRMFDATYDGVFICIDEADSGSKELQLGALLKLLTERLQKRSCDHMMIGLAGLFPLRDVLRASHPSALRIFEEIQLERLSPSDTNSIIDRCLARAKEKNLNATTIDDKARVFLGNMSEGYPHFIQQFGYSAFEEDEDGIISLEDAIEGAFGSQGALRRIGDRYYRDDFYNKIQKDSYRQVLRIMAERGDAWISKEEIRKKFEGKETTLSNALHALRERNIILAKESDRGVYRLQHKGFAIWIRLQELEKHPEQLPLMNEVRNAEHDRASGGTAASEEGSGGG